MAQGFLSGTRYDQKASDAALLIERTATEIDIPVGTVKIGYCAFAKCGVLEKVTIPDSVNYIDYQAFHECYALKEIKIPDAVDMVMSGAFASCRALKEITFPEKITAFNHSVCKYCYSIEKITAKGKISRILPEAFYGCSACLAYDFSGCASVPKLDNVSAFQDINNDAKIYVPAGLYDQWIVATNWVTFKDYIMPALTEGEATYPETFSQGLEYVEDWWTGNYTLVGRGSCTDSVIVIPTEVDGHSVTYIDDSFLQNDSIVEECWIPGVELISSRALDGCVNLKKLYLFCGSGLQSFSFINLPGLKYVKIGPEVLGITSGMFASSNKAVFDFSEATHVLYLDEFSAGEEFGENPFIFVPPELYEEWKNDTNWAYYADRIFPALRP